MRRAALVRVLRLGLLAIAGILCGAALPAAGGGVDQDDLARIEAYFNGLHSLRASFVQIAPDGSTSTGTLYYQRPDRMRLEYDPPSGILVVALGWQLLYHDRRLDQRTYMPTRSTPLGFLLQDEVRLGDDVTVTHAERVGDELRVTLVRTEEPDQGQITLVFAAEPIQLLRWAVTDPQGLTTHIILENLETDVPLDRSLFVVRRPSPAERR